VSERQVELHFEQPAERLDKFLVSRLPEFSRSRLQGLIRDGYVNVNGRPAHKAGQMLDWGAVLHVTIPPTEPGTLIAEQIPLDILYENDDLLVVNKPAGMVVHPAAGHTTGTLVHAALAHSPEMEGIGGEKRPGVVHRLDKDTSGIILLAKNDAAHHWLQEQFRMRRVNKTYIALVDGKPSTPTGRIEAAIGRSPAQRKQMAVTTENKGREAISEYRVLENFPRHTLLEVHPITGRTHQIRLHLAFIGCPVAGDTVYGRKKATITLQHHFLHAASLSILLPGQTEQHRFEAPLPPELMQALESLRNDSAASKPDI
jgi:23S rRNA pseudouridine1911/1915/1917 synthase